MSIDARTAPAAPCLVIDAGGRARSDAPALIASRMHDALRCDAPAVIVLCAAGEPLLRARAELRALDAALRATANAQGLRVSRSATEGLAAWAASRAAPIGVDVQAAPDALDTELLAATLHADEQAWLARQADRELAFARLWAGKEAVLKAFGVGLAWSPREAPVLPIAGGWHALNVPALGHAWFSQIEVPGVHRIAVAVALNAGFAAPA